jgi:hypothetical protein
MRITMCGVLDERVGMVNSQMFHCDKLFLDWKAWGLPVARDWSRWLSLALARWRLGSEAFGKDHQTVARVRTSSTVGQVLARSCGIMERNVGKPRTMDVLTETGDIDRVLIN